MILAKKKLLWRLNMMKKIKKIKKKKITNKLFPK
jgi:hypothetical protein